MRPPFSHSQGTVCTVCCRKPSSFRRNNTRLQKMLKGAEYVGGEEKMLVGLICSPLLNYRKMP